MLVVLDAATTSPLAAAYEFADVVRDGVVTDFVGAVDLVRRLKREVEDRLGIAAPGRARRLPAGRRR